MRRTHQLDLNGALPFYEVARRFAPYEPGYYWYEGAVWMNAVRSGGYKESAKLADQLFARGIEASPYAANNRLARAELHRVYSHLLDEPENLKIVLSWNKAAMYWRPNDPVVRAEYLKTLVAMDNYEEASLWVEKFLLESPGSQKLLDFKASLKKSD